MVKIMRSIKKFLGIKILAYTKIIISKVHLHHLRNKSFTESSISHTFLKIFRSPKVVLIISAILLSSCQGGGGDSSIVSDSSSVLGLQVSGIGSDAPVITGNVNSQGADGRSCGDATTDAHGNYAMVIPLDCTFPVIMNLTGGYDLVSKDDNYTNMYSVVLDSMTDRVNVTPLSTIIYYAALARTQESGISTLTGSNLDFVTTTAMRYFNFGIDSAVEPGFVGDYNPLTIKIGSQNACVFVKANEGLMETVRRTALYWWPGTSLDNATINKVLKALGDDIADGVLDGFNGWWISIFRGNTSGLIVESKRRHR